MPEEKVHTGVLSTEVHSGLIGLTTHTVDSG